MGLFLAALLSVIVVGLVLLLSDFNLNQTRRIELQVRRDNGRIRARTLRRWSAARIARRYPNIPIEQIHRVRREMARHIAADQEVRLLETLWSMDVAEAEFEG
ncbi:MAG: hypothetical protein HKN80_01005 [Acidimicrobiia bacterium]|nr:hypothetical protein [Acidimicrobiia bacterium]